MSSTKTAIRKSKDFTRLLEINIKNLYHPCDPNSIGFKTTDDLPDLETIIGQPRAIRAFDLGSEVSGPGYNIFVLGTPGSGRTTLSLEYFQRKAAKELVPDDWIYINNFQDSRSPLAIRLPAGKGGELKKDLNDLLGYCQTEIPKVFESQEYIQERDRLIEELKNQQEMEFKLLQQHAEKFSFLVARAPFGLIVVPAAQGKPLSPEEIEQLSSEQKTKLEQIQGKLSEEVENTLKRLRNVGNATSEKLAELNTRTISFLISPVIEALKTKYQGYAQVVTYLETVKEDLVMNVNQFQEKTGEEEQKMLPAGLAKRDWRTRYEVNLFIDNSHLKHAPVIVESHPVYHNLIGRIEHEVILGATRTDFTMIRPGAFHRANGGYLIIPARDLLINPYAWEGMKRVLRDGSIRIIELSGQLGLVSTATLEPQPIPLNVKVVLVGTPLLYYLLQAYDEDFSKLFKVRAEFATSMERTKEAEAEYGLFVKSVVLDNNLPPFDATAVAKVIEFSSRLAEDQHKLTTRFGRIVDVVREAAYWAKKSNSTKKLRAVNAAAVEKAIEEARYRNNLLDERLQEMIAQDIIMISTSGSDVGKINALSVIPFGEYTFGKPNRLSASVTPGRGGVIDIERQAKLGGAIHTKGVMILSGFLNSRYGRSGPLNVSASLTFEQSYSEIDGDSASAAEAIVLLSGIANIPIRQDIAITGSINQHGQIQAVGGVNEKIEGFFAICKEKGLSGNQGVIIPKANLTHLMLNKEVRQAIKGGQFHIWAVSTIDEALSLFSGMEAGSLQEDGSFPASTFNNRVTARLAEFAKALETKSKEVEKSPQPPENNTSNRDQPSVQGSP